jgi:hypothetical protein
MPTITLTAVPRPGATAYDGTTDTTFREGVPTYVDDPTIAERFPPGFVFEVVDNAAPAPVADPPAEQAVEPLAPSPAPAQ